ncbi:MAG TPA: hypothetical protein VHV10_02725 [Ktedonobacteraceae bacterium]|jgi:hypothetical protein|nr:hypothetical protein [Ktedonobacteraceae bacterium]
MIATLISAQEMNSMQALDLLSISSLVSTETHNDFEASEKKEEIEGFDRICKMAFYEMQLYNNIPLEQKVMETIIKRDRKGNITSTVEKTYNIKGSEIHGRWKEFINTNPSVLAAIQLRRLTGVRERIRDLFAEWILTESWEKFKLIKSEKQRAWVYDNANITVTNAILIEKHEQARSGKKTFVDDTIRILMVNLITNREALGKQAAGVNRAFKLQGLGKDDIRDLSAGEKEQIISAKGEVVESIAKEIRDDVGEIRKNIPQTEELPIVSLLGGGNE